MSRLGVAKTYKLFIGGAFPRSESGRTYPVAAADGRFLANVARASRKDARDAVVAARKALPAWSAATAYNRGQVLYRVAELLEGRREQFVALLADGGVEPAAAAAEVDASVDRWVWYAGWTDKVAQVAGSANPVAGPYFTFSVPEPVGVAAVLAPQASALLGLVSVLAPPLVTGNTVVVVASEGDPLPAIALSEVLATSDVPAGVVNVLTGSAQELGPVLAAHRGVDAIDLSGVPEDSTVELEREAAGNLKRLVRPGPQQWSESPGMSRLLSFVETKTVWHPVGI